MFYGDYSLESIDLSSFDTTNVVNMNYMFHSCKALNKINLSNFDTRRVTSMIGIFSECSNLIYIDISKFNSQSLNDNNYSLFIGRNPEGTIKYNSKLFNKELIEIHFLEWNKIDLNSD